MPGQALATELCSDQTPTFGRLSPESGSARDSGSWKPVYRWCLKSEGRMKLGRKSTGRRREPRNVSREGVEEGEAAQEWPYLGSSYFFPT